MSRSFGILFAVAVVVTVAVVALTGRESQSSSPAGVAAQCTYRDGGALPDPKCTPGAVNHAVTQATIRKTICVSGWTATVRPSVNVTAPMKLVAMRRYGYAYGTSPAGYEFDHLIPLELGGATVDARNLFPEPHHVTVNGADLGAYAKDGVENALRARVCSGKMKLADARRRIRMNWTKATTK